MSEMAAHRVAGTAMRSGASVSQNGIHSDPLAAPANPIQGTIKKRVQNPCDRRNPVRHADQLRRKIMAQGTIAKPPNKSDSRNAELAGANCGSVSTNPRKNHSVAAIDKAKPSAAIIAIMRSTGRPCGAARVRMGSGRVTPNLYRRVSS